MEIINLYKYIDEDAITISPIQRHEDDEPYCVRLVADDGKELVNQAGERFCCIDTHNPEEFTEEDAIPEEEPEE